MANRNPNAKSDMTLLNDALLAKREGIVPDWLGMAPPKEKDRWGANAAQALALQANVEALGRSFTLEALKMLSWQSQEALKPVYVWLIGALRESKGGHREFRPMYPNFPEQVIAASEEELLKNAAEHYAGDWVGARVLPNYPKSARKPLDLSTKPKEIRLLTPEDGVGLFRSLLQAGASWSPEDRDLAAAFIRVLGGTESLGSALTDEKALGQKENLAVAGAAALRSGAFAFVAEKFNGVTDVLRLATALCDGDPSLASPPKFGKISRGERKKLLGILERALSGGEQEQALENMFSRREQWLRLGERLHPGEFAERNPKTAEAFKALRSGARPQSFAGKAQSLITTGDAEGARALLRARPGVFARWLSLLLRKGGAAEAEKTLEKFAEATPQVATQVLLQAFAHFRAESAGESFARVFMPKGGLGKVFVAPAKKEGLQKEWADKAAKICEEALLRRFSDLPPLGKTYVDERLSEQNVPFATRSASRALKSWARGSKSDTKGEITRFFVWWSESKKEADGSVTRIPRADLDLSCALLDANYEFLGHCSWTDLRGNGLTHSGDITSAPNGACEFIDVDYAKLDPNVAFVAMAVNVFSGQTYDTLPECFAGWMERSAPQSGEIFDPRTVSGKLDLAAQSDAMLPVVLDVKNRKAIWADLSLRKTSGWNTVTAQSKTISHAVKGIVEMRRPTLMDLFKLHAKARGELVEHPEGADTVFAMDRGITPTESDRILSEFVSVPASSSAAPPLLKKRPKA